MSKCYSQSCLFVFVFLDTPVVMATQDDDFHCEGSVLNMQHFRYAFAYLKCIHSEQFDFAISFGESRTVVTKNWFPVQQMAQNKEVTVKSSTAF